MSTGADGPAGGNPIDEVLAAYRQELERGNVPDPGEWLRRYPDLAEELTAHFDNERWFQERAGLPTTHPGNVATGAYEPGPAEPAVPLPAAAPERRAAAVPVIPGYEVHEKLGEGGFGEVYKAREHNPERWVALKVLRHERRRTPREEALFRAEADRIAGLHHDHILKVFRAGEAAGRPFFTMPLLEGGTLVEHRDRYAEDSRATVRLLIQIASALHHAHQRGLLHRDLKPGNILLDREHKPYVADFGLSRFLDREDPFSHPGVIEGSAPYMAPEQARGDHQLTVATDVYGVGAICYYLLAGRPPFSGSGIRDTLTRVQQDEPSSPRTLNSRVDRDLEAICLKCLAKEPTDRYDSAAALAADLRRWEQARPVEARPLSRPVRLGRLVRRYPALAGLTLLAVLLVCATVGTFLHGYQQTEKALGESRENLAGLRENHYRSLVGEARALRLARVPGYRDAVWHRLEQARDLDTPERDPDELRMEAVACMGDFLGLAPRTRDLSHPVRSVALRPGGEEIALGLEDGAVLLREALFEEEARRLPGHTEAVTFLAFNQAGERLVSGDAGGGFRVWKVGPDSSATLAGSFDLDSPLGSAALTTDGGHVAVCTFGKEEIDIRDVQTGGTVARLRMPGPPTPDMALHPGAKLLAFGPDGRLLVAACHAEGQYQLAPFTADPPGQMANWRTGEPWAPGRGHIHCLAFGPEGQSLFCGCGQGLLCYAADTLCEKAFVPGDIPAGLAIGPEGRMLALASAQLGVVRLFGLGSPQGVTSLPHARSGAGGLPVHSVAFSGGGRSLVAAGGHTVRRWQVRGGLPEASVLAGHPLGVPGLAFGGKGTLLASASKNRTVALWDLSSNTRWERLATLRGFRKEVQTAAFGPGEEPQLLATGDFAGEVRLYAPAAERENRTWQRLPDRPGEEGPVWSVAFGPRGKWFAAGARGGLRLWALRPKPAAGEAVLGTRQRLSERFVRQVCFGPQGRWLAWAEIDPEADDGPGEVFVKDLRDAQVPPRFLGRALGSELSLGFVGDQPRLAFVREDRVAVVWDVVPGGKPVQTFSCPDPATSDTDEPGRPRLTLGPILAVSPDGQYLASAERRSVSLWDLKSGKGLAALPDAGAAVWSLAWGAGEQLGVGTSDGGLTVWRLPEVRARLSELQLDW